MEIPFSHGMGKKARNSLGIRRNFKNNSEYAIRIPTLTLRRLVE
jgi:hypothetical protein